MQGQGERVKAILPMYYALMLEPNAPRSIQNYLKLRTMLSSGVSKSNQTNIMVQMNMKGDTTYRAIDVTISLISATKYTNENSNKTDLEFFCDMNELVFSMLTNSTSDTRNIWKELYATTFSDLVTTKNVIPFTYYISQSNSSEKVVAWIQKNKDSFDGFKNWLASKGI